jgi:hypothetical protein
MTRQRMGPEAVAGLAPPSKPTMEYGPTAILILLQVRSPCQVVGAYSPVTPCPPRSKGSESCPYVMALLALGGSQGEGQRNDFR